MVSGLTIISAYYNQENNFRIQNIKPYLVNHLPQKKSMCIPFTPHAPRWRSAPAGRHPRQLPEVESIKQLDWKSGKKEKNNGSRSFIHLPKVILFRCEWFAPITCQIFSEITRACQACLILNQAEKEVDDLVLSFFFSLEEAAAVDTIETVKSIGT